MKDEKIVGVKGKKEHSINLGRLDPKAEYQWLPNNSDDRLLHPLIRNTQGELEKASWEEAMDLIVQKAKDVMKEKGGDGVAILCSDKQYSLNARFNRKTRQRPIAHGRTAKFIE
ncbi:molybdopterin-dependent oxidoreductase [Alteribacillus sp. YIM 98480]|uniref:molybdopterin-dependent oxidoreductase n=1 Tax=Alteribacillus sp. YIM 98480 TaxID=2606599 RepID=UPI001E35CA95|nr:molybdopterin-dependent oxidoreductase [Alteribacillus sp. YIM 98480]